MLIFFWYSTDRDCVQQYKAECSLPVFYGVSAMGTRLCFYKKHRDEPIEPPFIPAHPELQTNAAPQERWDCDLLDDDGERRFLSMVEEIKQACAVLVLPPEACCAFVSC